MTTPRPSIAPWVPIAIGGAAVALSAVGLLALRSEAAVARLRAGEAAREAVSLAVAGLEAELAKVAAELDARIPNPNDRAALVAFGKDRADVLLVFDVGPNGATLGRAAAPGSAPASRPIDAAERTRVEAFLEEAAFQEHQAKDPAAAAKAYTRAAEGSSDPRLRASVSLASAAFELRRGNSEGAASRLAPLLEGDAAAVRTFREGIPVRQLARLVRARQWKDSGNEAAAREEGDRLLSELDADPGPAPRAVVDEVADLSLGLDGRIREARGAIERWEARERVERGVAEAGAKILSLGSVAPLEGAILCLGSARDGVRAAAALDPAAFLARALPAAAAIPRAAGFPIIAAAGAEAWGEAAVPGTGGLLRVGLPRDFDPTVVKVGVPPWASAALVVLLGSTVAGGAWFLTRASRREVAAARAKSEFLAGVTHELKTPLTSIRLYGEMLEEGRVPDAAKRQEYVRTIGREAERLTELIDRVLTLARLEQGQAPPRALGVTAAEVARDAEAAFRPVAEKVGMRFLVNVDAGDTPLSADSAALVQALVDLLENARKYAAAGGVVELTGRPEDSQYCFEVADRGPGLPAGDSERLFAMFARGEDDSIRGKVGLGIGLALARRIVEAQGGSLAAGNREGGGAVFRIRLPVATP